MAEIPLSLTHWYVVLLDLILLALFCFCIWVFLDGCFSIPWRVDRWSPGWALPGAVLMSLRATLVLCRQGHSGKARSTWHLIFASVIPLSQLSWTVSQEILCSGFPCHLAVWLGVCNGFSLHVWSEKHIILGSSSNANAYMPEECVPRYVWASPPQLGVTFSIPVIRRFSLHCMQQTLSS